MDDILLHQRRCFPYLQYLRLPTGQQFRGALGDYHDARILKAFEDGLSCDQCVSIFEENDSEFCKIFFENSLAESIRRERGLDIKIMDYVQQNILNERCFHTFNHPSNKVMWQVVIQLLDLLSKSMAFGAKPPVNQYLDEISAAIPSGVSETAGFSYRDPVYRLRREPISNEQLIRKFYDEYRQLDNFKDVLQFNRARNIVARESVGIHSAFPSGL